jgi:phage tail-like protein
MSQSDGPAEPSGLMQVRVRWEGGYVEGVRRVGPLRRSTEVVTYRDGQSGGPEQKVPGPTRYDAVVVELDVRHDRAFEQWADRSAQAGSQAPPDLRTSLRIELHESDQLVLAYDLFRCWVSQFQALPDIDSGATAAPAIFLQIECDGWARDFTVPDLPAPIDP